MGSRSSRFPFVVSLPWERPTRMVRKCSPSPVVEELDDERGA